MLTLMAIFYIFAGIMHFVRPAFFLKIVPPRLPYPKAIVYSSGVAEIVLGVLLFPLATRSLAAWGVILLLLAVFPANIYQFLAKGAGMKIPMWALALRLPLQFVLMYWAYLYT